MVPSRGRKWAGRVLMAFIGLLFAVLLIEVVLRLVYGALPARYQIALRFVHVHPFTDTRLAPLPLWQANEDRDYQTILRPGARDEMQIGSATLRFRVSTYAWWNGRVGFRSPQPETGGFDAVAIGDSHTFCFVELADCWVTLLNDRYKLNLVNMGQPVTGAWSHEKLYFDFVAKPELKLRQPKLVIWQFFSNDFNDDYVLAQLNGVNRTPPPANLPAESVPEGTLARWLTDNSALYALIETLSQGSGSTLSPRSAVQIGDKALYFNDLYTAVVTDMTQARNLEGETLSYAAMLRSRALVEQNGGAFVIVVIPTKDEVYRPLTEPLMGKSLLDGFAAPRLRMLDFCATQKLTCFDALPTLQAAAAGNTVLVYHADDSHLNPMGNRALANGIGAFLVSKGLVK